MLNLATNIDKPASSSSSGTEEAGDMEMLEPLFSYTPSIEISVGVIAKYT